MFAAESEIGDEAWFGHRALFDLAAVVADLDAPLQVAPAGTAARLADDDADDGRGGNERVAGAGWCQYRVRLTGRHPGTGRYVDQLARHGRTDIWSQGIGEAVADVLETLCERGDGDVLWTVAGVEAAD